MPFDIEAARKSGYTDDEILQHLTQSRKFDIEAARAAGYSNQELIDHLSSAPTSAPAAAPTSDGPGGILTSLGNTASGLLNLGVEAMTTPWDSTASAMNPAGAIGMKLLKGVWDSSAEQVKKGKQRMAEGHPVSGARRATLGAIPYVGPLIEETADKYSTGRPWEATTDILTNLLPFGAAKAAKIPAVASAGRTVKAKAGGAARGAASVPIERTGIGGVAGRWLGEMVGAPDLGTVVGAGIPNVRAALKGAREAKAPAPPPIPPVEPPPTGLTMQATKGQVPPTTGAAKGTVELPPPPPPPGLSMNATKGQVPPNLGPVAPGTPPSLFTLGEPLATSQPPIPLRSTASPASAAPAPAAGTPARPSAAGGLSTMPDPPPIKRSIATEIEEHLGYDPGPEYDIHLKGKGASPEAIMRADKRRIKHMTKSRSEFEKLSEAEQLIEMKKADAAGGVQKPRTADQNSIKRLLIAWRKE